MKHQENYLEIMGQKSITETLIDMLHVIISGLIWGHAFIDPSDRLTCVCVIPSAAVCHHSDADINLTYSVSVGQHRAVPAQLGSAAAAVRHQEEKEDGGNIPSQLRGEKAGRISRIWKARPASTIAQRRTPHIMNA